MKKSLLTLAALLASASASAETIAIVGGHVAIGDGSAPIENGTVIVRDGRIAAVGADIPIPAQARRIDATGKWVSPGIIAGFSDLGITEVRLVDQTNDVDAKDAPFSASLDVSSAINPNSSPIPIERASGVTRAFVTPRSSNAIFAGLGAVIDLGNDMDALTKPRAFALVEFGETGAGLAGGSRPANFAAFRNAIDAARTYARNPNAYEGNSKEALLNKADAAAINEVISGRVPLFVHVERASDIMSVLGLAKETPSLKLVLVGASEGWMVAREIAAAKTPVLADALIDLPISFEHLASTQSNIGRMAKAGVDVAMVSVEATVQQNRQLRQFAGNLVALTRVPGATGLDWNSALASITSKPAEAIGMGNEIGSLRPGRRADVVVWTGDPLELSSFPTVILIDGVEQPLVNRQTLLRDRYMDLTRGDLPKAYQR